MSELKVGDKVLIRGVISPQGLRGEGPWVEINGTANFGSGHSKIELWMREDGIESTDHTRELEERVKKLEDRLALYNKAADDDCDWAKPIAVVFDEQVRWHMDAWGSTTESGEKEFSATDHFEKEHAMAVLLNKEIVFLNSNWWRKAYPEEVQKQVNLFVNCNDVFAWACSDAEQLLYEEIEDLYAMWEKDPVWGSAVWCMKKRGLMPQRPVEKNIRTMGIWDLDSMNLAANPFR